MPDRFGAAAGFLTGLIHVFFRDRLPCEAGHRRLLCCGRLLSEKRMLPVQGGVSRAQGSALSAGRFSVLLPAGRLLKKERSKNGSWELLTNRFCCQREKPTAQRRAAAEVKPVADGGRAAAGAEIRARRQSTERRRIKRSAPGTPACCTGQSNCPESLTAKSEWGG